MTDTTGADLRRDLQDRLLEAALPHIPFDGWTRDAFAAGASEAGLDIGDIDLAFRRLPDDGLDHFADWADRNMLEALRGDPAFPEARTRDKIAMGVRKRLESMEPHREAVQRSAGLLSHPGRGPLAARLVWRTSDRLWREAGDVATDFNHYSKRALLSAIVGTTTLYWLNDSTPDRAPTWDFLHRRIETVLRIGGRAGRAVARGSALRSQFCRNESAAR